MLNFRKNQEYKTMKNSEFQQSSFFAIGRKYRQARRKCSKSAFILMDEIFDFFSTETGKRNGYKVLNVAQLSKELELSKNSIYTALEEIDNNEIYIVLKDKKHNYIVLPITEESQELKRLIALGEIEISFDKGRFDYKKTSITNINPSQNIEKVIQFSKSLSQNIENETNICSQKIENGSQEIEKASQNTENGSQKIENRVNAITYVVSDLEGVLKNPQESYKESLLKKPIQETSLVNLGSSKEKNNFTANLFDDLEKIDWVFKNELKEEKKIEVKTAYEKKETIEPKKIFSENKQEQVKKDFPELQFEKKRSSEAIKDLTDSEREVQAFLTKELEILNQDLFFSFIRKLPNDVILSKARYVFDRLEKEKDIDPKDSEAKKKKITNPEGFLRAILSKELAKNETAGNVDITGKVKQNDYKPVILYFSDKKMIGNKDRNVTNTNRIDDYANIEKNKSCIAFEIYSIYCKGYKENKQEFKPMLSDIFNDIRKLIHLHDFKEILATNSYIYSVQDVLIEMFRGENNG